MNIASNTSLENHTFFEKKQILTPNTADSYQNSAFYNSDGSILPSISFESVEKFNSEFFINSQEQSVHLSKYQSFSDNQSKQDQLQFVIKIIILKKNGEFCQEITKKIEDYHQDQSSIKFIFGNQYQKINFSSKQSYLLKAHLITKQGFERKLCQFNFNNQNNLKRSNQLITQIQNGNFKLGFSLEQFNQQQLTTKFYFLDSPIQSIQQILDQKQRLVNKSQELNNIKNIQDLKGLYYQLSKQNMGSRILQKLLNKSIPKQIQKVYKDLKPYFSQIIQDRYGNYVFQKILELSPDNRKNNMFKDIQLNFLNLVKTKTGTHTLQKLINCLNQDGLNLVIESLKEHEVQISKNEFGTHFMQHLLSLYPHYLILCTLLKNFLEIGSDKYGIVVLKSLLKVCSTDYQYMRYQFLKAVQLNTEKMIYDQYGHYIIQEVFQFYGPQQIYNIANYIVYYINEVSDSIYSSSVVKKGLQVYGDYLADPIIAKILQKGLDKMLESKTGSFVLHRIMDISRTNLKYKMIKQMKILILEIKNYENRNKWKKFFNMN